MLAPGQALSVPELSRQLDVSRSPVREAVLALVADGLAVEQPRRGVAVAEIDAADMLEIHEVRECIEAQAARLCAERAGSAVLRKLAALLVRQGAVVERGRCGGLVPDKRRFSPPGGRGCRQPAPVRVGAGAGRPDVPGTAAGVLRTRPAPAWPGRTSGHPGSDHPPRAGRRRTAYAGTHPANEGNARLPARLRWLGRTFLQPVTRCPRSPAWPLRSAPRPADTSSTA